METGGAESHMGISTKDRRYMRRVLELAEKGRGTTSPNPMVGAILVRDDAIIGEGYHQRAGLPHAEVEALQDAGGDTAGATLYVNLEPCCHQGRTPPCTEQIIEAGIERVVMAMLDPNPLMAGNGFKRLQNAGIEVDCGCLVGAARHLNEAFITYHLRKRPFIIAKWAMTLDGRTSTQTGDSRWISNDKSRKSVHEIRSSVDAIAVGVGTIFFDNPHLTVRLDDYSREQPRRIIFDGGLRVPRGARCFDPPGDAIVVCSPTASQERQKRLEDEGHTVLRAKGQGRIVHLASAMEMLAEMGIQSILIEGGRQLHTSLIREKLIDKVQVFVGPKLIGGAASTSPLQGLGISKMNQAIDLKNVSLKSFGTDAYLEGYIQTPPSPPKPKDL
ncbi:MAG: bifunctional diaminohydroxyphosphoribosylaminopyrimidine deaminase/5-amino-6-(5-phosphoribosylamino)uracil reductase RibD [Candidatus Sumerlaeota bacterium]